VPCPRPTGRGWRAVAWLFPALLAASFLPALAADLLYRRMDSFAATLQGLRAAAADPGGVGPEALARWQEGLGEDFPMQIDWALQDPGADFPRWLTGSREIAPSMVARVLAELGDAAALPLLEQGHGGVRLSREDLDKLACWIDLLVPYCGDYEEANAWTDAELAKYRRYLDKRRCLEAEEARNLEDLLQARGGAGEGTARLRTAGR